MNEKSAVEASEFDFLLGLAAVREKFLEFAALIRRDPRCTNAKSQFDIRHPGATKLLWIEYFVTVETVDENTRDWILNASRNNDSWTIEAQIRRRLPTEEYDQVEVDFSTVEATTENLILELQNAAIRLLESETLL